MPEKVLIVEDDPDISNIVAFYLTGEGYSVGVASDGTNGLKQVKENLPDLLILDLRLPELDGLEICKILRRDSNTSALPILMLTAMAEESDKIVGLELGADDYVTKPFSTKELVGRVKALLRRCEPHEREPSSFLYRYGPLVMNETHHDIKVDGKGVRLTAKEFALLGQLLKNKGRVLTREVLLNTIWGYDSDVTTRTIDAHVRTLRKKIPFLTKAIQAVVSCGYKLIDEGNQEAVL